MSGSAVETLWIPQYYTEESRVEDSHMSRKPGNIPTYSLHRASGQAIVRLSGRDHYLGPYDSPESREKYDRLIAEWLANGRQSVETPEASCEGLLINELLLKFVDHAERYYVDVMDGKKSAEVANLKIAIRPVKLLYGRSFAKDFGPNALKAVRQHMVDVQDLSRREVNKRIGRIKRVFRWAVSEELVAPFVFEGLRTVEGLKLGRTTARENPPVKPVDDHVVDATLPFLTPTVAAMVQLQRCTGMRPGEITIMRPCDIERSGDVWVYRPTAHKTTYLGVVKDLPLGPLAQDLIRPFLDRSDEAYLFSPKEAEAWRNEHRSSSSDPNRKTKIYPSELRARAKRKLQAKKGISKRPKRDHFDTDSYRRAIKYAIAKAERNGVTIPSWHPHQLRHTRATEIRRRYGVEGAQVALGHSRADVTQIYAERNFDLAARIAKETG